MAKVKNEIKFKAVTFSVHCDYDGRTFTPADVEKGIRFLNNIPDGDNSLFLPVDDNLVVQFAYITHDQDKYGLEDAKAASDDAAFADIAAKAGELKPAHIHVVIRFSRSVLVSKLEKAFGIPRHMFCGLKDPAGKFGGCAFDFNIAYLTHRFDQTGAKFRYDDSAVTFKSCNPNITYQSCIDKVEQYYRDKAAAPKPQAVRRGPGRPSRRAEVTAQILSFAKDVSDGKYPLRAFADKKLLASYGITEMDRMEFRSVVDNCIKTIMEFRANEARYMPQCGAVLGPSGGGKTLFSYFYMLYKVFADKSDALDIFEYSGNTSFSGGRLTEDPFQDYLGQRYCIWNDFRFTSDNIHIFSVLADPFSSGIVKSRNYNKRVNCSDILLNMPFGFDEFILQVFLQYDQHKDLSFYLEDMRRNNVPASVVVERIYADSNLSRVVNLANQFFRRLPILFVLSPGSDMSDRFSVAESSVDVYIFKPDSYRYVKFLTMPYPSILLDFIHSDKMSRRLSNLDLVRYGGWLVNASDPDFGHGFLTIHDRSTVDLTDEKKALFEKIYQMGGPLPTAQNLFQDFLEFIPPDFQFLAEKFQPQTSTTSGTDLVGLRGLEPGTAPGEFAGVLVEIYRLSCFVSSLFSFLGCGVLTDCFDFEIRPVDFTDDVPDSFDLSDSVDIEEELRYFPPYDYLFVPFGFEILPVDFQDDDDPPEYVDCDALYLCPIDLGDGLVDFDSFVRDSLHLQIEVLSGQELEDAFSSFVHLAESHYLWVLHYCFPEVPLICSRCSYHFGDHICDKCPALVCNQSPEGVVE